MDDQVSSSASDDRVFHSWDSDCASCSISSRAQYSPQPCTCWFCACTTPLRWLRALRAPSCQAWTVLKVFFEFRTLVEPFWVRIRKFQNAPSFCSICTFGRSSQSVTVRKKDEASVGWLADSRRWARPHDAASEPLNGLEGRRGGGPVVAGAGRAFGRVLTSGLRLEIGWVLKFGVPRSLAR